MDTPPDGTLGLIVRFHLKPGLEQDFDEMTAQLVTHVRKEPGTLLYLCHTVDGSPGQRIFYELYQDRSAFEAHETQSHVRRFLQMRDAFIERFEIDFLDLRFQARPR